MLVQKILENEKNSENIVICVISNDPSLSTKHGSFYLDEDKGVMFFMLHAQRESVNGGIFHPYWSVEEWASFLREAMGENANDIANVIVDSYYALSDAEEEGLKAVVSTPDDESIVVKKIRSMPQKKMWKSTVSHNGVVVSNNEDAQTLPPKSGQNKIVAQVLSPTGVSYARIWEQDSFSYRALNDDGQLYSKFKEMVDTAKSAGVTTPMIAEVEKLLEDPKKPVQKGKLDGLGKMVDSAQTEVFRVSKVREVENLVKEVASRAKGIGTLAQGDLLAPQIKEIKERLVVINKNLNKDVQLKVAENFKKEVNELKAELTKIEKDIAERNKGTQETSPENKGNESTNFGGNNSPVDKTKNVPIVAATNPIDNNVGKGKLVLLRGITGIEKDNDIERFRNDRKAEVQKLLDDPDNDEDKIENREDLKKFIDRLEEAKTLPELEEIEGDVKRWKRLPIGDEGGVGALSLIFVLIVLGAIGFFLKKILSGKTVAMISFQKTGSTDASVKAEARLNKPLRFDEALDCEIDVRATPKRNESGNLEYELISPNKTVWLLKLGNDKKKHINEIPVSIEEGVYQIFDHELAMQPMGKAEFESIEVM